VPKNGDNSERNPQQPVVLKQHDHPAEEQSSFSIEFEARAKLSVSTVQGRPRLLGTPTNTQELTERYGRGERFFVAIDLAGADLRSINLTGACLLLANLEGANLAGANLSSSVLQAANLRQADLTGANLAGAQLQTFLTMVVHMEGAVLRKTNLRSAGLSGVNLSGAILEEAILEGADLREACLMGANLGACIAGLLAEKTQLSKAVANLETVRQSGFTPQEVGLLLQKGLFVSDLRDFPSDDLKEVWSKATGLTLCFKTRLTFVDEAIVRAVLASALGGRECSCTIEPTPNGVWVVLSGLPNENLLAAADRLHDFFAPETGRLVEDAIERTIFRAIPPAVNSAVHESVLAAVPAVIHESMAPLVLAHAQLGEKIVERIETVFGEVLRTEIQLSGEVVDALDKLRDEMLEEKLGKLEFRFDRKLGRLVREGAWAAGTGAAGSGLFAAIMELLGRAGG